MQDHGKLAIDGGAPLIISPIPTGVSGPSVVGEEEIAAVTDTLRGHQLFRYMEDSNTAAFEKESAEFVGTEYALMVNSGTSALTCAIIGVGAGPGDPGLLTLKGKAILERADCVVYDSLVNPDLMSLAPKGAFYILVSKTEGEPATTQKEIHRLLVDRAHQIDFCMEQLGKNPMPETGKVYLVGTGKG